MSVEYATPIAHNQFPATVLGPAEQYEKVRAVITPTLLVVYGERDRGGGMHEVATERVVLIDGMRPDPQQTGWIVTADNGEDWTVRPYYGGCGCGSPLKHMPQPPPVWIGVEP